eukprot:1151205-Pelagomonas_calceolata.AAC.3
MGISGIDTRDLTIALRDVGCLVGVMSTDTSKTDETAQWASCLQTCQKQIRLPSGRDVRRHVRNRRVVALTSAESKQGDVHGLCFAPSGCGDYRARLLELIGMAKSWSIVGKDLLAEVSDGSLQECDRHCLHTEMQADILLQLVG